MSMVENSGDKEMGNSNNNLPDVVKTNDAPSPVLSYIEGFYMLGWKRDTNNSSIRFTIREKHVGTSFIYFLPRPIYRSIWKIYVIGISSSSWIEDRNHPFSFRKNCEVGKLRRFPLRIPLLHLDKHQRRCTANSLPSLPER